MNNGYPHETGEKLFDLLYNMLKHWQKYFLYFPTKPFYKYSPDHQHRHVTISPVICAESKAQIINAKLELPPEGGMDQHLLFSTEGLILCSFSLAEIEFEFLPENKARVFLDKHLVDHMRISALISELNREQRATKTHLKNISDEVSLLSFRSAAVEKKALQIIEETSRNQAAVE